MNKLFFSLVPTQFEIQYEKVQIFDLKMSKHVAQKQAAAGAASKVLLARVKLDVFGLLRKGSGKDVPVGLALELKK